ncbi:MAG: hypothetical protein AAB091_05215, partial [Elusimicrobiota bacterium]
MCSKKGNSFITLNRSTAQPLNRFLLLICLTAYLLNRSPLWATPATKLAFINIPGSANVSECVSGLALQAQDATSIPSPPDNSILVALSDPNGGHFYDSASPTCDTMEIYNINIYGPGSHTSGNFKYKKTSAGNGNLTAVFGGLNNGAGQAITITGGGGGPIKLAITAGPASITGGSCNQYTVTAQNSGNTAANVSATSDVTMGDGGMSGIFYSDPACVTALPNSKTSIAIATSFINVYYKKLTTAGSPVTLTATDVAAQGDDLSTANGTKLVTVTEPPPDRLAISAGPASINMNSCTLYTVVSKNVNETIVNVFSASRVDLTDPGDSSLDGFF